jgi:hypothetical protein
MTDPGYDVALEPLPGDEEHHPRCPWADEGPVIEDIGTSAWAVAECRCDDLRAEDDDEARLRRWEGARDE